MIWQYHSCANYPENQAVHGFRYHSVPRFCVDDWIACRYQSVINSYVTVCYLFIYLFMCINDLVIQRAGCNEDEINNIIIIIIKGVLVT